VVVVSEYGRVVQALDAIKSGKAIANEVPDLIVNDGVVKMTVLEWLQFLPSGPDSVKATLTVCDAVLQSITLAFTWMKVPRLAVDGKVSAA
jgi:hypothetical protein